MQVKQALSAAAQGLASQQVPSPQMNAELLLRFVLNCDRAYLFAHPERELTDEEQSAYDAALGERARGVPAQYITGHQEFWGMDLVVTPAVLIPRPETEHVIEAVLELSGQGRDLSVAERRENAARGVSRGLGAENQKAGEKQQHRSSSSGALRIADIGTGSGCIVLALAHEFPLAEIHATDISSAALEIARANAARHQFSKRIVFHQADLLAGLKPPFDFVVSNPPYVGDSEEDEVQLEVRKFEPRTAVFAGSTGTEIIARIIPQARALLSPGGWLIFEISGTIAQPVRNLLSDWREVQITPDLQGIPRIVRARKPSS